MATVELDLGAYQLGWHDSEEGYVFKSRKGLDEDIIREISWMKGEPEWMTKFRLHAYAPLCGDRCRNGVAVAPERHRLR